MVMGSMSAYREDLQRQSTALSSYLGPAPIRDIDQTIFTGSGDSLAAAMLAESLSEYQARAIDPLEICRNPTIIQNRLLHIVSVSGRTATNIQLAERHPCVAITANPDSPLADAATHTIPLQFPNSDTLTAGSISFLNSALVCMSLVRPLNLDNAVHMLKCGAQDARGVSIPGRVFFVGNQHTFPIAMYAAAKMYEIRGSDAHYCRLEQFYHMELFSARPGDTVVLFDDAESHAGHLDALRTEGIPYITTGSGLTDVFDSIIYHISYAQHLPLYGMEDQPEVYFMEAASLRGVSDAAIY